MAPVLTILLVSYVPASTIPLVYHLLLLPIATLAHLPTILALPSVCLWGKIDYHQHSFLHRVSISNHFGYRLNNLLANFKSLFIRAI